MKRILNLLVLAAMTALSSNAYAYCSNNNPTKEDVFEENFENVPIAYTVPNFTESSNPEVKCFQGLGESELVFGIPIEKSAGYLGNDDTSVNNLYTSIEPDGKIYIYFAQEVDAMEITVNASSNNIRYLSFKDSSGELIGLLKSPKEKLKITFKDGFNKSVAIENILSLKAFVHIHSIKLWYKAPGAPSVAQKRPFYIKDAQIISKRVISENGKPSLSFEVFGKENNSIDSKIYSFDLTSTRRTDFNDLSNFEYFQRFELGKNIKLSCKSEPADKNQSYSEFTVSERSLANWDASIPTTPNNSCFDLSVALVKDVYIVPQSVYASGDHIYLRSFFSQIIEGIPHYSYTLVYAPKKYLGRLYDLGKLQEYATNKTPLKIECQHNESIDINTFDLNFSYLKYKGSRNNCNQGVQISFPKEGSN